MGVRAYLSALPALLEQKTKEYVYQMYVTDTLKLIAENTSNIVRGSSPVDRYVDMIKRRPADNRTGEQVAADVIKKAGLKVVNA